MSGRRVTSAFCLLAGAVLAIGSRFFWTQEHSPTRDSIAVVGRRLPPLPVVDSSGNHVDLSQVVPGRRTVIAFFSSSCRTCRVVLPELHPFPDSLRLLLVSEDATNSTGEASGPGFEGVITFRDRRSVFVRSFPLSPLPTILFVDERGILRGGFAGVQGREQVQARLQKFAEGDL
jgi:hypothetical protein